MSVPLLKSSTKLWLKLIEHLRIQGASYRESGAFLLGQKTGAGRVVTSFLPYEQLQDDALHDDYVSLSAASFTKLWDICRHKGVSVVADIHTHRLGPRQSYSDRTNPMVGLSGHIAFIVPRFAQGQITLRDLGLNVYEGNHKWTSYFGSDIERLVILTRDGGFDDYA